MDARHPVVVTVDLAVGVLVLLAGLVLLRRRRAQGTLLTLTGLTWLAGAAWAPALFWHRGPLVNLLLAHPGWRPHTVPAVGVTLATYLVSVVAPLGWFDERATAALAVAVVGAALWNLHGARGVVKHHRRQALWLSLLLGSALAAGVLLRVAVGDSTWLAGLLAYELAVAAVAVLVVSGSAPVRVARLRDLVIDLGDSREHPGRDALARTLRDPDLVVASWDEDRGEYLAGDGTPVPVTVPGRGTTRVDRDGQPALLLVHDAALVDDSSLREAVRAVETMETVNVRWRREVAQQAAELAVSRRRLLAVADDERRRLAHELDRGVGAHLDALSERLAGLPDPSDAHLARAADHLARTREELAALASGLRPRALDDGLEQALSQLVTTVPVPVEVEYAAGPLPPDVELAVYYLCAESLANVAKHAPGARANLTVSVERDRLRAAVVDDGPGGAGFPDRGGLLGLRDRVEALGGSFALTSSSDGTSVSAELPLGGS